MIFRSKQEIDAHNAIHAQGGRTSYYMRYTKFSDQKTFPSGKKKGYPKTSLGIASRDERTAKGGTLDDSIDWRSKLFNLYKNLGQKKDFWAKKKNFF